MLATENVRLLHIVFVLATHNVQETDICNVEKMVRKKLDNGLARVYDSALMPRTTRILDPEAQLLEKLRQLSATLGQAALARELGTTEASMSRILARPRRQGLSVAMLQRIARRYPILHREIAAIIGYGGEAESERRETESDEGLPPARRSSRVIDPHRA